MQIKSKHGRGAAVTQNPLVPAFTLPETPSAPKEEFSAGEVFVAGQMKYNPVVRAGVRLFSESGSHTSQPFDVYSPYSPDEIDLISGYDPELFVNSRSREETASIMKRNDRDLYVDHILQNTGAAGLVSSVAGGFLNPLYAIPLLGWAGRATTVGQRFRQAAIVGGGTEAASEAILHAASTNRDLDTSAIAITSGAIFSGIVGSFMRAGNLPEEVIQQAVQSKAKLQNEISHIDDLVSRGQQESSLDLVTSLRDQPEVERLGDGEYSILGWGQRAISGLTPARVLSSVNPLVRKLGAGMGEQNLVGNSQEAIETLVKRHDGLLDKGIRGSIDAFDEFRKSKSYNGMRYSEFHVETARALRRGDTHKNPFVEQAAKSYRASVLEPMKKLLADADMLDDTAATQFAQSYFPRHYNFGKMKAEQRGFLDHISGYIREHQPMSRADAELTAREVYRTLTNRGTLENVPRDLPIKTGPLQGRTLAIPDEVLEPWLISEPDIVLRHYIRQAASEYHVTKRYGDTSLQSQLDEVDDEWVKIISEADPSQTAKLERQRQNDMADLRALRDRLLGRYKLPENPDSGWVRAGRAARNLNIVRLLGGMTLSAFPDIARPLYAHGLGSYAKAMTAATSMDFRKVAVADLKRMGVGLDMTISNRLKAISEMDYMPQTHSRAEHFLDRMVSGNPGSKADFGRLSLMSYWNSNLKTITGLMSQDGLLMHVSQPEKFANKLSRNGIDGEMARRIRDQYKKYGKDEQGLRIGMSDEWDDVEAALKFESTVLKEVDATIVTPGIMDKPLWMSSELGKVLGQLKSFGFASTNKQLLAGLNNFDGHFIQGALTAVTMGALTYNIKRSLAGREAETDPQTLMMKGIEYSGVVGFGSEMMNISLNAAKAAGVYQGDGNYRWARQGMWGSLLGPSAGLGEDALRSGRVFFRDEPNGGDIEAMRRMLPYNNLFYIRGLFDRAEQAYKAQVGAE